MFVVVFLIFVDRHILFLKIDYYIVWKVTSKVLCQGHHQLVCILHKVFLITCKIRQSCSDASVSFFKANIWGLFLHPFMNLHDFSQIYNDLLLSFFQTKSCIFNVFMQYQCDIQIQISVMELTLTGDMTITLPLEKTSGGKFCPQRQIKVIWTTECIPLQPLFLVSFFFFWWFCSINLLLSHLWYTHRKTNVNTATCTEQHNMNDNHNLLTCYTILRRILDRSIECYTRGDNRSFHPGSTALSSRVTYLQMAPCPGLMSHLPSFRQKFGCRSQMLLHGSPSMLR